MSSFANELCKAINDIPACSDEVCTKYLGGEWDDDKSEQIKEKIADAISKNTELLYDMADSIRDDFGGDIEEAESILREASKLLAEY